MMCDITLPLLLVGWVLSLPILPPRLAHVPPIHCVGGCGGQGRLNTGVFAIY
jgi:hypothetical protein